MKIFIKSFFYIVACAAIFIFIMNSYGNSIYSVPSATAFEWEKTVNVYFVSRDEAANRSCEAGVAVPRMVINAETLGPGALEALINGLTLNEMRSLSSSINPDTLVQKFEIKDRVAYVDFNSRLNEGVGGSCAVVAIRSQIEKTLTDLPDIDSVVISVNGETEGILEP